MLLKINIKPLITLIKPSEKWRPLKDEDLELVREAHQSTNESRTYEKQNEAFEAF